MSDVLELYVVMGPNYQTRRETARTLKNTVKHSVALSFWDYMIETCPLTLEMGVNELTSLTCDWMNDGYSVIYENENLTRKQRVDFLNSIKAKMPAGSYKTTCVVVAPTLDVCGYYALNEFGSNKTKRLVKNLSKFEVPQYSEGWDNIVIPEYTMRDGIPADYDRRIDDSYSTFNYNANKICKGLDDPILANAIKYYNSGRRIARSETKDKMVVTTNHHTNIATYSWLISADAIEMKKIYGLPAVLEVAYLIQNTAKFCAKGNLLKGTMSVETRRRMILLWTIISNTRINLRTI